MLTSSCKYVLRCHLARQSTILPLELFHWHWIVITGMITLRMLVCSNYRHASHKNRSGRKFLWTVIHTVVLSNLMLLDWPDLLKRIYRFQSCRLLRAHIRMAGTRAQNAMQQASQASEAMCSMKTRTWEKLSTLQNIHEKLVQLQKVHGKLLQLQNAHWQLVQKIFFKVK